DYDECFVFKVI
ncbi:hypothetical protein ZEAMMB73_Zm00001d012316, partial [Zea mays]